MIRLATRSSAQARTQAEVVAQSITAATGISVELVFVETLGDRNKDQPLHQIGGQGIFVKEVQQAVLRGDADIADHSAKDLPSQHAEGLVIGAWCERRDARDALVGKSLNELEIGATVATGSVRRRARRRARISEQLGARKRTLFVVEDRRWNIEIFMGASRARRSMPRRSVT